MRYKIFIDDERDPVYDEFIVVRNFSQFVSVIEDLGPPSYISFDHDLGHEGYDGYTIAKLIVDLDLDRNGEWLPRNFDFHVHSANPVGKTNIENYLNNYLRHKNGY